MKKSIKYILIFVLLEFSTGCKKFLDVNTNPNSPTTAPINGLLTNATLNSALNVFRIANITSYYVQYLASPNESSPTDVYEPIDASNSWTLLYDNMTDIYDLEKLGAEQGATQYQGVAKILMAMNLHLLQSVWGAAPYSQAFSGEFLTPTYDEGEANYQRCITLLDEAITLLQQTGSTITIPTASDSPDLIHEGDSEAWIRTAHALKARLMNQLSKTGQYNPANILNELSLAYSSPSDDASVATFDERNPWNQVALNNQNLLLDGWMSEYFIQSMDGTIYGYADPRLPYVASLTQYGDYRGTRNGKGRIGSGTAMEESYISLSGHYSSPSSPLYIITFEELKFIEAEAAWRANDMARAYAAYIEGIKVNMDKVGVSPEDRDIYVDLPAVSVGAANLTLEMIFREKYKALFLNPESWNDARRFDYQYTGFQLPLNAVTSTYVRRLVYPSVETSRNGANVPQVTDVTGRLWWDQ